MSAENFKNIHPTPNSDSILKVGETFLYPPQSLLIQAFQVKRLSGYMWLGKKREREREKELLLNQILVCFYKFPF